MLLLKGTNAATNNAATIKVAGVVGMRGVQEREGG